MNFTGDPEIDVALQRLMAQTAGFEEVARQINEIRGHAEAADGRVVVETLPTGTLASLRIDPRALRLGAEALAAAILQATQAAAEDATTRATTLAQTLTQ